MRKSDFFRSIKEAFEDYENSVEKAIASLGDISIEKAKALAKQMRFDDYIDFSLAVYEGRNDEAEEILSKYIMKRNDKIEDDDVLAIAQEMKYHVITNKNIVIIPEFKLLGEFGQRAALNEMNITELQKILANIRGFKTPGIYEASLLQAQMLEEILLGIKNMKFADLIENSPLPPGKQQQLKAYGSDTQNTSQQDTEQKKTATFTNDQGEQEEGEVLSQAGQRVTIRTKTGVKNMNASDVMISEQDNKIIKLKDLKNES